MNFLIWGLAILSLIGVVLNIKKKVSGFYLWLVADIGWVYVDIKAGLIGQAALFVIYSGLCIYGIIEWRKLERGSDGRQ